ncbi:MAG: CvpA family protein [Oscillospiraceae bacterium]|nr:CvpA family protein [Oscillospiraceae bacterium]
MDTSILAIVLDAALVAALLIGTLVGRARGLFKSLMRFVVVLIALFGANLAATSLTASVMDAALPAIEEFVQMRMEEALAELPEVTPSFSFSDLQDMELPDGAFLLDTSALPEWMASFFEDAVAATGGAVGEVADALTQAMYEGISGIVASAAFIVAFLILLLLLRLLMNMLNVAFKLPVINSLNSFGGALFGLVEAAAWVYVVLQLYLWLGALLPPLPIDETFIVRYFAAFSPLSLLSGK